MATFPKTRLAVAMLVMAAGYGCAPQSQSHAGTAGTVAVSGADRQGHYGRSVRDMSICVTYAVHKAHPELEFVLNVDPPETLTAMSDRTEESKIWAVEFHNAGSDASDVMLRNVKAAPSQLDEIWRFVESCSEQS